MLIFCSIINALTASMGFKVTLSQFAIYALIPLALAAILVCIAVISCKKKRINSENTTPAAFHTIFNRP